MTKRTTTQWTTTTKRTTRGTAPDNIDAELDHILADCRWNAVIRDVEQMPLGLARKLRDRLDTIFGGAA